MPIVVKNTLMKFKDSDGSYKQIDAVGEAMTFDAEAYGTGKRNGINVVSGDNAYQNNAKYYMEQASAKATAAANSAAAAASSA